MAPARHTVSGHDRCMPLPSKVVFNRADAAACDLSGPDLRRLVRRGDVVQLRRDAFCAANVHRELCALPCGELVLATLAAQSRIGARTWATGLTVPRLHRLALPLAAKDTIDLVAASGTTSPRRYRDLSVHVARVPEEDRDTKFKLDCVTLARAIVDIGRAHDLAAALIVGDDALRRSKVTRTELVEALDRCGRMPGIRAARLAVQHMSGERETPIESESWAFFVEEGIPLPVCQQWINGDRVDFLWRQARLVGEADGRVKYQSDDDADGDALWREKVRSERIEDDDYDVVRWTYADLRRRRASLKRRILRHL